MLCTEFLSFYLEYLSWVFILSLYLESLIHTSVVHSLVEDDGIEPTTPCLQSRCSPSWANPPKGSYAATDFSPHLLIRLLNPPISQATLNKTLSCAGPRLVGLVGLEPTTPALSRRCSNQLSYRPNRSLPYSITTLLNHYFTRATTLLFSLFLLLFLTIDKREHSQHFPSNSRLFS